MDSKETFWEHVNKNTGTDCWLWTGAINSSGYGHLYYKGKHWYAHRLVLRWKLKRKILPKHQACHTCDIRLCCNPLHIFEGTNLDNVRDMWDKGRQQKYVLSQDRAKHIRKLFSEGWTYSDLAYYFKVSLVSISLVLRNESWKDPNYKIVRRHADRQTIEDMFLMYKYARISLLKTLSKEFNIPLAMVKKHIKTKFPGE